MYSKKLKIGNIMNAINACTEMNFQKRISILLDVLCDSKGLKFEKVQPSNGDAKNDGWICNRNIYFAMYSPNDSNISQNNQIVKKLDGDLRGLCEQVYNYQRWGKQIRAFYLIVNTHDKDLPADPDRLREQKIEEIKNEFKVEFSAEIIHANDIKKYVIEENDEVIEKISDNLDIETYISVDNLKIKTLKKIEINQLTNKKEHILSLISSSDKIEQYVSYVLSEGIGTEKYDKLKNYIIDEYKELEIQYSGEELYEKLLDKLIYDSMLTSHIQILEAFVVNIFIRCDIFKKE